MADHVCTYARFSTRCLTCGWRPGEISQSTTPSPPTGSDGSNTEGGSPVARTVGGRLYLGKASNSRCSDRTCGACQWCGCTDSEQDQASDEADRGDYLRDLYEDR